MILRHYQTATIDAVRAAKGRGITRMYYVLPTGTGKTAVFTELVKEYRVDGRPALVLAHRDELLKQAREAILRSNPKLRVAIERADVKAPRDFCDVVVASIQTLSRKESTRLQWLADIGPSIIICDEAHHCSSEGWGNVLTRFTAVNPHTPVIGCTATPSRLDRAALHGRSGAPFEELVYQYEIADAINEGYLCQIRGFRVSTGVDLSHIKRTAGDYSTKQLADAVNVSARTQKAIYHWAEIAGKRQTIVFCVDVGHVEDVTEAWSAHGHQVRAITGDLKSEQRAAIIEAYKQRKVQVLVNCEVLTEGFDAPYTSCIVMLRPTESWSLYAQMIGRGTRLAEGKDDLIVLDVVDNVASHKLTAAEQKTASKKKPASVSGILGLPAGIDLQGHTVTEAAQMRMEMIAKAAVLEKVDIQSYDQIKTMLQQVDLFKGVSTADNAASGIQSEYRWLQLADEWVLRCGENRKIQFTKGLVTDVLHFKLTNQDIVTSGSLGTTDFHEAIRMCDLMAEQEFSDIIHLARVQARWRTGNATEGQIKFLKRLGIDPNLACRLNKGEASALIEKRKAGSHANTNRREVVYS